MPQRLDIRDPQFTAALKRFIENRHAGDQEVSQVVGTILRRVREEGDTAVLEYTRQLDRFDATNDTIRVSAQEIARSLSLCTPELIKSLKVAASRIREYSYRQLPPPMEYTDETGTRLGHQWTPLQSVGLYVPGGKAAYPSSVLMNAMPALTAGVTRLAMVVPAPEGHLEPSLLAAAHVAGISEIYKIGGAQAVGALAFGTQTIAPVDKIVGPGNAYVAEAKRQVFGHVGIDMIAGPSEVLIISDNKSDPAWIAADLLSQAEHDRLAQSVLVTDDAAFGERVCQEVSRILLTLARREIAEASWERFGAVIVVENMHQACAVSNTLAPEHLELAVDSPDSLLPLLAHAGAIFLGRHTPEAIGDYIAGPSHVLPTSRTARFSSGLSVYDFLKRTSIIGCSAASFAAIAHYGEVMAYNEGLGAHELSLRIRRGA